MTYEIEVRANPSESKWNRIKSFLDKNAEKIDDFEYWTCLFKEPTYLRLRRTKGKDHAIITIKYGEGAAKVETNQNLPMENLKDYLLTLKVKGYTECAFINSTSHAYNYKEVRINVNKIDHLGLKIEVEILTDEKDKVEEYKSRVREILEELELKELPQDEYQQMLDKMYEKSMTRIDEISGKVIV